MFNENYIIFNWLNLPSIFLWFFFQEILAKQFPLEIIERRSNNKRLGEQWLHPPSFPFKRAFALIHLYLKASQIECSRGMLWYQQQYHSKNIIIILPLTRCRFGTGHSFHWKTIIIFDFTLISIKYWAQVHCSYYIPWKLINDAFPLETFGCGCRIRIMNYDWDFRKKLSLYIFIFIFTFVYPSMAAHDRMPVNETRQMVDIFSAKKKKKKKRTKSTLSTINRWPRDYMFNLLIRFASRLDKCLLHWPLACCKQFGTIIAKRCLNSHSKKERKKEEKSNTTNLPLYWLHNP